MSRRRAALAAATGVLVTVVVGVGLITDGTASDVLTGAVAVVVLALVAESRLAQRQFAAALRRDTRRLRQDVVRLRDRSNRTWESVHWTRRNTEKLRDEVSDRLRRLERAMADVGKKTGYQYGDRIVEWRQVESLQNLYALLTPRQAVPAMRGWAASPDVLLWIVGHVLEQRPRTVLECGSGVSTLWTAYAMERVGSGRVISLEHDPYYADRTRELLARHGLTAYAEVRTAPLVPVRLGDQEWQWYDTDALAELPPIDLLFVDGPPAATGPRARYPAGPLVADHLAPEAVILLDDAVREDEREIGRLWADELGLAVEHIKDLEKQALVFRR